MKKQIITGSVMVRRGVWIPLGAKRTGIVVSHGHACGGPTCRVLLDGDPNQTPACYLERELRRISASQRKRMAA